MSARPAAAAPDAASPSTTARTSESSPPPARRGLPGWAVVVVAIALIGGGITLWEQAVEDRVEAKRFGVVEPGEVYRSGQISPTMIGDTLDRHKIGLVIDMTGYDPADTEDAAEQRAIDARGIRVERVPMRGSGVGTPEQYAQVVAAVHHAREQDVAVLMHCAAGSQRTGGTVAAYRLLVQQRDPAAVFEEATRYDWDPVKDTAWPEFLNANMPRIAALLVEKGVIDEVPDPLPYFGPGG